MGQKSSTSQPDTRLLVHTPAELAAEHLEWAESIQKDPGIGFGIEAIDRKVIPMRPGNLVTVVGRPGDGKSSLMAYLAVREAERIIARNAAEREAVVYVTWEQVAEELETLFQADGDYSASDIAWGRANLDVVRCKAVRRAKLPIWVIGHSVARAGQRPPRMTVDVVLNAVETMEEDFGVKPTLMLFDYMQRIPVSRAADRIQQVAEVPFLVKDLAQRIGVPAVVGAQASRRVDDRQIKLAEMNDCQWGSSIEQDSDKVFSLWRPWRTENPGTLIQLDGRGTISVSEWLLLIRLLKQRGERGRHTWAMFFQPQYLKLAELEQNEA